MGIKVNQFDSTGKLLGCYDSYSTAAEHLSCDESTIRKAAKDNRLVFGKFYFEDAELRGLETQMGGMYEIGQPSKLTTSKLKDNLIEIKGEIRELRTSNSNSINDPIVIPCDEYFTVKPSKITQEFLYNQPEIDNTEYKNTLIIGDLHEPFTKVGYLDFCKEIYIKHNCDSVIFIGDLIDNHFSSFHDTDPDGHGAAKELELAKQNINKWYRAFPIAKVCIGNHDLIPVRKSFNAGISKVWLRSISEVLETPNWDYNEEFLINNVLYVHGTGRKAANRMMGDLISIVQGHYHSESYIQYAVGKYKKMFAMQIGCGVDDKSYAMAYGKHFDKMHINCGVILESGKLPILEYMEL